MNYKYIPWSQLRMMYRRNRQRNTEIKMMLVLMPMVVVVVYWMMFG